MTGRSGLAGRAAVFAHRMRWDSRVRNEPVARATRQLLGEAADEAVVLDIGSGALGLRTFLPEYTTIGADIEYPTRAARPFVVADIAALPIRSRAVDVVTAVDVLEYLSVDARERAVRELVRVAKRGVVAAFPQGEIGRAFDEEYKASLDARSLPAPDWLGAHLAQRYPTVTEISTAANAEATGRTVSVSASYTEPVRWGRWPRRAATRSRLLFLTVSLALGAVANVIGTGNEDDSYRALVIIALS